MTVVYARARRGRGGGRAGLRFAALLFLSVAVLGVNAFPAPADGSSDTTSDPSLPSDSLDLALERTPVIVEDSYQRLPPIGDQGQMGINLSGGSPFFLSHQQHGDIYVRAGIIRDQPDLIERGLQAFDYAFARQRPDGSFGAIQTEEYAFFVQSVAHSILLLKKTPYAERYRDQLKAYRERLLQAARHMISTAAWSAFKHRNTSYTHSGYTVGTALAMTGRLTGRRKLKRRARKAVELALGRQRDSGVNPELGGYDVRYQMAGLTYAERWTVYFPRHGLTPAVREMVDRGIRWMSRRIEADGRIDWTGSTRTCVEKNTSGRPKTPGYSYAIRGFAYWGALQERKELIADAERLRDYLDSRTAAESLCDSPSEVTAAKSGEEPEARSFKSTDGAPFTDLYE